MPNDLEDFLKRAAALRQRKAAEQKAMAADQKRRAEASRPKPYTNRKRERQTQLDQPGVEDPWDDDDRIVMAEMVDTVAQGPGMGDPDAAETKKAPRRDQRSSSERRHDSGERASEYNAEVNHIVEMLRAPGGVKQAFLMREILNRPKF